jgi:hypothetical protein
MRIGTIFVLLTIEPNNQMFYNYNYKLMAPYERSKLTKELFLLEIELQSQERLCKTFTNLRKLAYDCDQIELVENYTDQANEYYYEAEKLKKTILKKINKLMDQV